MSPSALIDLSGKVALVSGASKGIGAAIAQLFAAAGADLVLFSRNMSPEATQAAFSAAYGKVPLAFRADVSDANAVAQVVERAAAHFGHIDILVNNAAANVTAPLLETTDAQWWSALNANLIAAARLSALCAPYMQARRWGRIINISSNLGVFALANKGAYSASKAALLQLTRNLALELGEYGILVNALAVGAINTDAEADDGRPARDYDAIARTIILKRLGTAQEVARVALFFASELSAFITGQALFVDGGASVWFPA
ncbi:MAG: SDR family oxidoreductase [Chloroflexota bacterium]|nr:MAG: SDR family oxidoreductase [Chloroflexota bacterium]